MHKYVYSRRGRNLVAVYDKTRDRWMNEDYLFSITLSGTEREFFEEFYREAEERNPKQEWGKERKLANSEDLMNVGERLSLDGLDNKLQAPSVGYEAAIIAKIDAQRGRYEADDIYPGVCRDADGLYQCAKFVPELGKSVRATFADRQEALTWITYQNNYYGKRAR